MYQAEQKDITDGWEWILFVLILTWCFQIICQAMSLKPKLTQFTFVVINDAEYIKKLKNR